MNPLYKKEKNTATKYESVLDVFFMWSKEAD